MTCFKYANTVQLPKRSLHLKTIKVMRDGLRGTKVLLPTKWVVSNDVRIGDRLTVQSEGQSIILGLLSDERRKDECVQESRKVTE